MRGKWVSFGLVLGIVAGVSGAQVPHAHHGGYETHVLLGRGYGRRRSSG